MIGRQLLQTETSIGANYREANSAHSNGDFVHKVNLAEKEDAGTVYWLEICIEAGLTASAEIRRLAQKGAPAARTIAHAAWLEAFWVQHPLQPARAAPRSRGHGAASPIHHP